MSAHELVVLFYNALIYPKMERLIYHYKFIRNIFVQDLITQEHKDLYEKKEIEGKWYDKIEFLDKNRELIK